MGAFASRSSEPSRRACKSDVRPACKNYLNLAILNALSFLRETKAT
jgi:hypothetical protein